MQCHELRAQLMRWSAESESLSPLDLVIDDGDVTLSKREGTLLLSVELPGCGGDEVSVQALLRLAHPSLSRFPGALARAADDSRLWLLATALPDAHADELIEMLEALLNQRDTWQSMLPKHSRGPAVCVAQRPAHTHFLGTGLRHA
ncbi:type III secretion system chaperone [Pseudomonas sp. S75]|uniref:type III secretion system chaperone n=1 Tax=unclassified Pseudomonas TaxID=196821 RepID=UPI0019066C03|nr:MULTISPECIES: type III secretion system chaperone [unclassified Pseudomonas]MBJ9977903.1 type III secretion system chaperone [Pseudomonas sp. S30]MBK0155891.1 type III secretion system chaperone [Pseudomonas sp. S75]